MKAAIPHNIVHRICAEPGHRVGDENFCIRKNNRKIKGLTTNSWLANNVVHRKCEECTHLPDSSRQATLRV
jgi:hypothetical protein